MTESLVERMRANGPKRILALDGGGIRGMITVEVLCQIERLLRKQLGNEDLVLSDYFDFVAGTSTGAIIATCIALGKPADEIRRFYKQSGPAMFDKASVLRRFRYKFDDENLAAKLRKEFGEKTTLGSAELKTLLMLVMRNATTDSPWPLSNNPFAKYNLRTRPDGSPRDNCNLDLPLWQLVRGSAAAPTFFPPEVIKVGSQDFVFVDGGLTMYNNPSFQAFVMATVEPYAVNWRASEDSLLLVSVGTGANAEANKDLSPDEMNLVYHATSVPSALMYAASNEQDMLCRIFGKCRVGDEIDRDVGNLHIAKGPLGSDKLFTYLRYNAELSTEGLRRLGITDIDPKRVQPLDSVDHIPLLCDVGQALAQCVKPEHFAGFV
jgi:patatin-like phospholipase/acyl hydrolase